MLSPKFIQDIVAGQYGLARAQLLGRRRLPHIVLARHIATLLCLEMLRGASLPQVGRWFHRDHTSVLHARDAMRRKIAVDPEFARQVEELRQISRLPKRRRDRLTWQ
jgi:chromosomal replication initiator protein